MKAPSLGQNKQTEGSGEMRCSLASWGTAMRVKASYVSLAGGGAKAARGHLA